MLKNWIRNQLTPAKADSEMWQGFTDELQKLYEKYVETIIKRIDDRKSLFSMNSEDLTTRMNELGQFFQIRAKNEASKPILLAQRLDEIHFKGTDRPITATFWREFDNLPVRWEPLYAPIDQTKAAYGEYLTTKDGVAFATQKYGDFFLTSRGKIAVSVNQLYTLYGANKPSELIKRISAEFNQIVAPLLPLDIVFDGFLLYLEFSLQERRPELLLVGEDVDIDYTKAFKEPEFAVENISLLVTLPDIPIEESIRAQTVSPFYFDDLPCDAWNLDAVYRPSIYPTGSATDARMKIGATSTTIDPMGASTLQVEYVGGEMEYIDAVGKPSVVLTIPKSKADTIRCVSYSQD